MFIKLKRCYIGQDTIIYGCTFARSVTIFANCKITYSCFDSGAIIEENCIIDNCFIGNMGFITTIKAGIHLANKSFYGIGIYDNHIEENWLEHHWPGVSLLLGET